MIRDEASPARFDMAHLDMLRERAGHRVVWTAEQFRKASGPIVYIAWDAEGNALYVGRSIKGLYRPIDPKHHRAEFLRSAASLEFMCCATLKDADSLERSLIYCLMPKHNGQKRLREAAPSPSLPSIALRSSEDLTRRYGVYVNCAGFAGFVR